MFIKNLFMSTLAVASLAAAQSSKLCQEDSNEIKSQADLDKITSCSSLSGDLVIGEDLANLTFNVQTIGGNFRADNAVNLASINMPNLKTINGDFLLRKCTALTSVSVPSLTKVGAIIWETCPIMTSFNAKMTEAPTVSISDTQLTSLQGIDLRTVKRLDVNNNKYLKTVTMSLKSVSEVLSLGFNAPTIAISFPELIWSNNITLIGAGSINFPKLQHINGSMNFGNTSVTSIACKNLTAVEQTLAFIGNEKVTELDFPLLEEIGGGFKIHNNSKLVNIDGFPKLKQVRGAIDFVGNFKNATLPSLEDVQGGANIQTTEEFDCTEFKKYSDDKVIKGDDFTCLSKQSNPTTADGTPGADNKDSSGNNKSAAGRVSVSALLGLSIAVIAYVS